MKNAPIVILALAVLVSASSCFPSGGTKLTKTPSDAELSDFQLTFMSSYFAERGGTPSGAKALTPFSGAAVAGSKATVPVIGQNYLFSDLVGETTILSDYPEPGQTTNFTVTNDATNSDSTNIYKIVVTTSFPSTDLRKTYVETYYVNDITVGNSFGSGVSDDSWTVDDFIVAYREGAWVWDQSARESMVLTFRDNSVRTETIVSSSLAGGPKFDTEAFDVNGSLELGTAFIPATVDAGDPDVMYSSVVVYYVTPAIDYNFWFWQGRNDQTILGVRYYTEKASGAAGTGTYTGYTASFEKTIGTLTTAGGDYATTMQDVFVGSEFDTLAQSVLRQQVVYGLAGASGSWTASGTGVATTNMKTRVVNIAGLKDFYLSQLDSNAVQLSSWATSTIYVPTGDVDEILANDPDDFVYERTTAATTSGGQSLASATVDSGLGSLATVYTSIQEGAAATTVTGAPSSNITGDQAWSFDGAQVVGTSINPSTIPALTTSGTVEAWVYIDKMTDTMGIVHKGIQTNFLDEAYSLQGWGSSGQIAMIVDRPGGTYDAAYSKTKLNTKKWYYLVGTWDVTNGNRYLKLYINGALDASATPSRVYPSGTIDSTSLGMMVGSQLPSSYSATYGYFGVDGKIVGVNVSQTPMSVAEALAKYNSYKDATASW
jgi:hypothetical protein